MLVTVIIIIIIIINDDYLNVCKSSRCHSNVRFFPFPRREVIS